MHAKWQNKDVGHAAKDMYFIVKPEAMHSELQSLFRDPTIYDAD